MRVRQGYLAVVALLGATLLPATAHAGIIEWLDRLSGPGPFWGTSVEVGVHCFGEQAGGDITRMSSGWSLEAARSCRQARLDRRHFRLAVTGGFAIAEDNPIDYGDSFPDDVSRAVRALTTGASLDYTFLPFTEAGAATGFSYFAGPRFDNFALPYVEARVRVRPLAFFGRDERQQERLSSLILSAGRYTLLGRIDAMRFGAPDNSSLEARDTEWRWAFGFSVDLYRLFR